MAVDLLVAGREQRATGSSSGRGRPGSVGAKVAAREIIEPVGSNPLRVGHSLNGRTHDPAKRRGFRRRFVAAVGGDSKDDLMVGHDDVRRVEARTASVVFQTGRAQPNGMNGAEAVTTAESHLVEG